MVHNQLCTHPHHTAAVCYTGLYAHHFDLISIPGAVLWEVLVIFTIFPPSYLFSTLLQRASFTQTPFFQVIQKMMLFWQLHAFSFLQNLRKSCLRKWYMARKRPSPPNLIRSFHCSAGFQEDRSLRQLDENMNHTMLKQLSHIHSVTKIHLFIISCNTAWDKVHC